MRGESQVPVGALNLISTNYPDHGHHGCLPLCTYKYCCVFWLLFRDHWPTVVLIDTTGMTLLKIQLYLLHTECHRRNGQNFGRVFLMLHYTDITQNTNIQSWTVTEIMAIEKCGHLAFPRTVRLQLCSALTVREQCGTHFCDGTSSAQRDKIAFNSCRYVQCLVTPRTTVTWVRVFL